MTTPFVYLIGWPDLNKFYLGVRYAQGCDPSDMWTKYFTSSKYVKAIAKEHGPPPVIDILRTFTEGDEAREFEFRLLSDNKVHHLDNFLNAAAGLAQAFTPEVRKRISEANKGKKSWNSGIKTGPESEEVRRKKSEAHKGRVAHNKGHTGGKRSEKTKAAISEARKGVVLPHMRQPRSEETKAKIRATMLAKSQRKGRPFSSEVNTGN